MRGQGPIQTNTEDGGGLSDPFRAGRLRGIRVLVVEDDDDSRDALVEILRLLEADVDAARNGNEGFTAFRRERPDVLVADLWMPDGDGYELIQRIRGLPSHEGGATSAIAVSAVKDPTQALFAGFGAFLRKPIDLVALIDRIESLAAH